jgi:hypothetical protein
VNADLKAREDLAEALVPTALHLVGAVHDDGPDAVHEVIGELPAEHLPALLVVVAAMVDPTRTPTQLLGWVEQAQLPMALNEDDPRSWSDETCHRLHKEHRRRGTPVSPFLAARRAAGWREWERRRKARARTTGNT